MGAMDNAVDVVAAETVCETTEEALPAKFVLPVYTAVSECVATANVLVLRVALPVPSRDPLPSVVEPSMKVTLPVAVPLEAVTVAVSVTD